MRARAARRRGNGRPQYSPATASPISSASSALASVEDDRRMTRRCARFAGLPATVRRATRNSSDPARGQRSGCAAVFAPLLHGGRWPNQFGRRRLGLPCRDGCVLAFGCGRSGDRHRRRAGVGRNRGNLRAVCRRGQASRPLCPAHHALPVNVGPVVSITRGGLDTCRRAGPLRSRGGRLLAPRWTPPQCLLVLHSYGRSSARRRLDCRAPTVTSAPATTPTATEEARTFRALRRNFCERQK